VTGGRGAVYEVPDPVPAAEDLGRIHFVGVGGVGMAPVARIAVERGLPVSGSDIHRTAVVEALAGAGVRIAIGQDPANLDGVDTVVVSTGVRPDNVEITEALRRGLRVVHRATALAALMVGRRAVLVAGTHGKTTVTSMLAVVLDALGADPSYAIGGEIGASGISGHAGGGEVFVAEADESDGTFLHYRPNVAVITNVELDHADYFASVEDVRAAFAAFALRIRPGGVLIACADDPGALAVGRGAAREGVRVLWYGAGPDAAYRTGGVRMSAEQPASFTLGIAGSEYQISLRIPGEHNVANAAAACAVLDTLGVPPDRAAGALAGFGGARRRMEFKGEAAGIRVYDDYMHHPTEIAATLAAFRVLAGRGRLIVAFQPQRYSRAQTFLRDYGKPLGEADAVVVLEVYPGSGEDPIPGVTGAVVVQDVPLPRECVAFEPDSSAVAARLAAWARPGDLVVTAGAGDVTRLGPQLLELLRAGGAPGRAAGSRAARP
jgi:UDP-N-acetylmuramate--alanine ligase